LKAKNSAANIVIEIVESDTEDTEALIRFVKSYRECGFNIALDDVGTGHSNFDRISLLRPDIIKIDRSIISGIATDYFKQEIFKSLAKLSKGIGSLILAEGVETKEEILCCLEYGADLLQGYFFSRPIDPGLLGSHEEEKKIGELLSVSRANRIDIVTARRLKNNSTEDRPGHYRANSGKVPGKIESLLKEIIDSSDRIDALYIINDEGIQ
jgi:EAL domain-containing protein (putative c-di-GMP-specific phosphodiesterase class I)